MNVVNDPWNVVYLAGFLTYVCLRGAYAQRTKREERIHRQVDAQEKCLLMLVTAGSVFLPFVYLLSPWLSFADYHLPEIVRWCGTVVMLAALWLFWRSHADLGANWSISLEVRQGHQLITRGVYGRIRHPMYAAIWLFSAAQAMLLANWVAGWSALATFAPMYFLRTPREERMLCEFLGQDYRDYMLRTGRLVPRFPGRRGAVDR